MKIVEDTKHCVVIISEYEGVKWGWGEPEFLNVDIDWLQNDMRNLIQTEFSDDDWDKLSLEDKIEIYIEEYLDLDLEYTQFKFYF